MLSAVRQGLGGAFRRARLPLGCYYAMTLLVPILNGAADSAAFAAHAAVVAAVPLALVVLVSAVAAGARRLAANVLPLR